MSNGTCRRQFPNENRPSHSSWGGDTRLRVWGCSPPERGDGCENGGVIRISSASAGECNMINAGMVTERLTARSNLGEKRHSLPLHWQGHEMPRNFPGTRYSLFLRSAAKAAYPHLRTCDPAARTFPFSDAGISLFEFHQQRGS